VFRPVPSGTQSLPERSWIIKRFPEFLHSRGHFIHARKGIKRCRTGLGLFAFARTRGKSNSIRIFAMIPFWVWMLDQKTGLASDLSAHKQGVLSCCVDRLCLT
jgi:hypothetical protein